MALRLPLQQPVPFLALLLFHIFLAVAVDADPSVVLKVAPKETSTEDTGSSIDD